MDTESEVQAIGSGVKSRWAEVFGNRERERRKECLGVPYEIVEVAGDAMLAARLGRGRDQIEAIDVYGMTLSEQFEGLEEEVTLNNWRELKSVLDGKQYRYWKKWVESNGYGNLPIKFHPTRNWAKINESCPYETVQSGLSLTIGGKREYVYLRDWQTETEPMALMPRETIMDNLGCIEVGKKWDIPVDTDVLEQADRDVKSGTLCLVDKPVKRVNYTRVLNTNVDDRTAEMVVDQLSEEREKYPKLFELCRQIGESGGVENYVSVHYGKAYLSGDDDPYLTSFDSVPRGYIRLYYPDLTRSIKSEEEQRRAVGGLYERLHLPQFKFVGVESAMEGTPEPMPVSENVRGLIDWGRLEEVVKIRGNRNSVICGEYEAVFVSRQSDTEEAVRRKVNPLLDVLGRDSEEFWRRGSPKLSRKLAKVLDPRSPLFGGFDYSSEQGGRAMVVISQNPTDILQASTGQTWTSCVNLDGGINKHSLYLDIEAGNAIAYVINDGRPVGRSLVRFIEDEDGDEGVVLERYYGDARFLDVLNLTVKQVSEGKGITIDKKGVTRVKSPLMYTDVGYKGYNSGKIYYGYNAEDIFKAEAQLGWRAKLVERLGGILRRRTVEE